MKTEEIFWHTHWNFNRFNYLLYFKNRKIVKGCPSAIRSQKIHDFSKDLLCIVQQWFRIRCVYSFFLHSESSIVSWLTIGQLQMSPAHRDIAERYTDITDQCNKCEWISLLSHVPVNLTAASQRIDTLWKPTIHKIVNENYIYDYFIEINRYLDIRQAQANYTFRPYLLLRIHNWSACLYVDYFT